MLWQATSDERGAWVNVGRKSSPPISGWLVGGVPQGLLVAIDDELREVRLVTDVDSVGLNLQRRHPALTHQGLEEKLQALGSELEEPLGRSVERMSAAHLHRAGQAARALQEQIRSVYMGLYLPDGPDKELVAFLASGADRAADLHGDLYGMLEDSGLPELLDRFGPRLAELPPDFTLPGHDLEFATREDLTSSIEAARDVPWSPSKHTIALEAARSVRDELVHRRAPDVPPPKGDGSTFLSRWSGPSLRILAGTGLVAMNAGLGMSAGLTATITTIGATAVPTYVGVATSIYTGLVQVAEGMEKLSRSK